MTRLFPSLRNTFRDTLRSPSLSNASRLHALLRAIEEKTRRRASLEEMLTALDSSKPTLFDRLRGHLASEIEAKALTVKILNLCLAKYQFHVRSTALRSGPLGLVVDPSNSCNLACPGCVHSHHAKELKLFDWNPGLLSEARARAFVQQYGPAATHATLCNYGEPLVNPETPKFIAMAKSYLLRTMLSTNMSLPRFDAEAYVESGLDYMVLSIDGATQPVYERFRKKGSLDLVLQNTRKLVEAKKRLNRSMPIVTWRFLAFEHNLNEIAAAIETARALGVDRFEATPAWDIGWDDPEIRPATMEPINVAFLPHPTAAVSGNWNPHPERLDGNAIEREFDKRYAEHLPEIGSASRQPSQSATCQWLYKSITMDSGGRIFPCCCSPRPGAALTFAQFDGSAPPVSEFNSLKHQRARAFFADPEEYGRSQRAGLEPDPYCVRCDWDKTADPSGIQIRNYFQSASENLFDDPSLDLLAAFTDAG